MITNPYRASCSVCGKPFESSTQIVYPEESELISQLEKNHWIYNRLYRWVLCPVCNEKLEIIEPEVIWCGTRMKISEFLCREK